MADEFETDVEITKVYEGKSGEGEYGPWTAYNFYVKDDERKFSWFKSDSKPIMPVKGMQIKLMEYVVKQSGEYTNYNVSRIILHGDAHKKAETRELVDNKKFVPQKSSRNSSLTMYISYAKDLLVALMIHCDYEKVGFNELVDMVVDEGVRMYDRAHGVSDIAIQQAKLTKEAEKGFVEPDNEPPPHTDDDISF